MLIVEYFPQEELKQLEQELWNLTMNDADISSYTNMFNELTAPCPKFVTLSTRKWKGKFRDWFNPSKGLSRPLDC